MKIKYYTKSKKDLDNLYKEVEEFIDKLEDEENFNYSSAVYSIGSYRTTVLLSWYDLYENDFLYLIRKRSELLRKLDELMLTITGKAIEIQ